MAYVDPGEGYYRIAQGIRQLGQDVDPYGTMDIGGTLGGLFSKLFRKNQNQIQVNAPENVPQLNIPMTDEQREQRTQDDVHHQKYSPDNPGWNYLNNGGIVKHRMSPQLQAMMEGWETNKKQSDLANQLANIDLQTKQKQLDLLGKPKPAAEMTPYESEKIKIDWYNATHKGDKNQNTVDKDYLLMSYPDLAKMTEVKPSSTVIADDAANMTKANKDKLAAQYSSAIRSNINDPKKAQQYIDRYNYLTGKQYTYNQWAQQAQKSYSSETGKPVMASKKSNQNHGKIVKNGIDKATGKKVVQYEDGTIDYQS